MTISSLTVLLAAQYIEMFTAHQHQSFCCNNDTVQDIDDVRNGLFLNRALCLVLGRHLAFLKVHLFFLILYTEADSLSE